jgi:TPR repeat protein
LSENGCRFSSGYLDELVLLKDGTGTSTLYKGSGEPEMTMELTFDPDVDSFKVDLTGTRVTLPVKYSRSEDGTSLTVHFPDKEIVYAGEEQMFKEVSGGDDAVQILRLGSYYSVAGNEKCVPLFTEAVKRGESAGNLNLGNYYYKTDKAKAFEYCLKAVEQGHAQAEYNSLRLFS